MPECKGTRRCRPSLANLICEEIDAFCHLVVSIWSNLLFRGIAQDHALPPVRDFLAESEVLRRALKEGKLTVIEAIYKPDSGEVVRLGKLSVVAPAYKLDIGEIVRVP